MEKFHKYDTASCWSMATYLKFFLPLDSLGRLALIAQLRDAMALTLSAMPADILPLPESIIETAAMDMPAASATSFKVNLLMATSMHRNWDL
jgi:hypothetical protein